MHKTLNVVWIVALAVVCTGAVTSTQAASNSVESLSISTALVVKQKYSARPVVVSIRPIAYPPSPLPPLPRITNTGVARSSAIGNIGKSTQDDCEDQCEAGFVASNQDNSIYMEYDLFVVVESGIRLPDELR